MARMLATFLFLLSLGAIMFNHVNGQDSGASTLQQATDTDDGWTIFQRRYDGSIDFYRGWDEYVSGFGSPESEFWLGLEKLHQLTSDGTWRMKILLQDWDDSTAYAEYDSFSIGDAASNYKLTIAGYSGTAGDGMTGKYSLNGMAFSTKDRDNDMDSSESCAVHLHGAWWYDWCSDSNLNGLYRGQSSANGPYAVTGMHWFKWKNSYQSLKSSTMMIRPK